MPCGVKKIQVPLKKKNNNKKAAFNLLQFEQELYSDSNKVIFIFLNQYEFLVVLRTYLPNDDSFPKLGPEDTKTEKPGRNH